MACFRCSLCGFTACDVASCPVCSVALPVLTDTSEAKRCIVCGSHTTSRLVHREDPTMQPLPFCCKDEHYRHYASEYAFKEAMS